MRRKWMHLLDKFRYVWYLVKYIAALALCPFLKNKPQYKELWIIAERGTDARDNASHLFRYIRENHPEINICYIISRDAQDREKMARLGRVVDYRSFEHFLVFAISQVKISTHIMGFAPDMLLFKDLDKILPIGGVKAFLQHGIIKDDLPYLYGDNVQLDLFVCGARREWEYIVRQFRHPDGVVQHLGLCRYDRLPSAPQEPSKILLLMPTWRVYVHDSIFNDQQFMACGYYQAFQSLLENPRLGQLLEKYGYTLKFFPHHGVQNYVHCFHAESSHVQIVNAQNLGVQQALIEADALLTDYSSVFFDFGYMMKPVLHYQFDLEDFRKNHYQEGYFDYGRDGFGPVCTREDSFLDALEQLLENGCMLSGEYRGRIEEFFTIRDDQNCRRNFDAIYKLWKKA